VSKAGLFLEEYRMKGEVPPEERMEKEKPRSGSVLQ